METTNRRQGRRENSPDVCFGGNENQDSCATRADQIYSCHEPFVSCIAKGKAHKPYEFGAKPCLVVTEKSGLALSMTTHHGNPYDDHLLAESKRDTEKNANVVIDRMLVDRGFRGHEIIVPVFF